MTGNLSQKEFLDIRSAVRDLRGTEDEQRQVEERYLAIRETKKIHNTYKYAKWLIKKMRENIHDTNDGRGSALRDLRRTQDLIHEYDGSCSEPPKDFFKGLRERIGVRHRDDRDEDRIFVS